MKQVTNKIALSLCVLGVGALAFPAPATATEIDKPVAALKAESAVAAAAKPISVADIIGQITPHRALYSVKLASIRNGSGISDISGRIYYSWADDCSAWNVEQKMQLRFYYSEGDVSTTSTSLISREAKDGSSYVFHMKRTGDDEKDKDSNTVTRGTATLKADSNGVGMGEAESTGSMEKNFKLSAATTFPAHHTMQLLAHAQNGKKFFSVNVFDGADENGLNEISSFIGSPVDQESLMKKTKVESADLKNNKNVSRAGLVDNPLLRGRAWPVRMAFFAPDSATGSPDYEMDITLLDNGVIRNMTVNYDDFSMVADLVSLEPLTGGKCHADSTSVTPPS